MRFLIFLLFLLFCAYALWARWYFVCQVRGNCGAEEVRLNTLQLTQGDSMVILDGYDQFLFSPMTETPELNANNEGFLDTLAALLGADTSQRLMITGFIRDSERKWEPERGFLENIGIARVDAIRSLLIKRGVRQDLISPNYDFSADPDLKEPLTFNLFKDTFGYALPVFVFTNMTFSDANFAFNSAEFRPGTQAVLYADSVKTYLELNPEKTLTIIGHTDAKGTTDYNYDLGLKRAESAKAYFRELGIDAEIFIESKGETEPVDDNRRNGKDYPPGRQKNRRVNFVIQ